MCQLHSYHHKSLQLPQAGGRQIRETGAPSLQDSLEESKKEKSMEFAVAAFSVVAGVALSKLLKVEGKPNTDASSICDDLKWIRATMREHASGYGTEPISYLQAEYIAQLRGLACDIEDRIDCFNAKKTRPDVFARQITELKERSVATTDLIKRNGFASVQGGAAQPSVVVPAGIQNLGGDLTDLYCLLYLCLIPRENDVRTKPLMRRWLAEGLVNGEQVAVKSLDKFIQSSSIIDSISIQTSNNGKVKRFKPTDAIGRYISERSMADNFIVVCDGDSQLPEQEVHRISVHLRSNLQLNLPQELPRLRTLAVFPVPAAGVGAPAALGGDEAVLDFSRYKVLRVLDLQERGPLSKQHLDDIIIKHPQLLMKYLSINLGSIDRIPRDIGNLNQLETLDLSGSDTVTVVTVYKEVLLLPKLKHLFGKFQLSRTDTIKDTYIPSWLAMISHLHQFLSLNNSKLETLAGFVTGTRYGFPDLMSLIKSLRKVKIWCKSDASRAKLLVISNAITKFIRDGTGAPLCGRSLSIDFAECKKEFVNEIVAVPGILDSLKLRGNLSQFPPFVAGLSGIDELCLCSTGLSWEVIVAGLLNVGGLRYLKLIEDNLRTVNIVCDDLKSIQRICIVSNTTLDIAIQADALPHLVSLHILCEKLAVLPGTPGIEIKHMKYLKEVTLYYRVADLVRAEWKQAVVSHTNKPLLVLLPSIQGP